MCPRPSAAFTTCVISRLANRVLSWADALEKTDKTRMLEDFFSFFLLLPVTIYVTYADKMHHWWLKCTDFILVPAVGRMHDLFAATLSQSDHHIAAGPRSENVTYASPMKRLGQTSLTAPVGRLFFSRRLSRSQVGGVWYFDSSSELISTPLKSALLYNYHNLD